MSAPLTPDVVSASSAEPTATAAPEIAPEPAAAAPGPAPIVIHHLDDSRSQRILWLLEELGVRYEIKFYKRESDKLAPPELKKVHPVGKSPVITDGSVTLAESGAIVEYLIHKYGNGRFIPTDAGYIDNLYYTHFAEGSLQPWSVLGLIFQLLPSRTPFIVRPIASAISKTVRQALVEPNLNACADMIEAHLAKSPSGWFAGGPEPTSADFLMSFALETLNARGTARPQTQAFIDKAHARDAYKRGLEKGGTYAFA